MGWVNGVKVIMQQVVSGHIVILFCIFIVFCWPYFLLLIIQGTIANGFK
jgi:hypothetical protein